MNTVLQRAASLTVGAALVAQSLGCGTIMYPDRRGYHDGPVDPGVVVLDGIGLLFFIIPGVIAFAVDFSDGAIYLPYPRHDWRWREYPYGMRKIPFPRTGDDAAAISAVVRAQTGRDVDLTGPGVRIVRLSSTAELPGRFAEEQAAEQR